MRDDIIQILAQLSDEYSSRTELYLKIRDQYHLLSSYIPSGDTERISSGMELVSSLMAEADICSFNISGLESSLNSKSGVSNFFRSWGESDDPFLSGIKQKRSESCAAAEKMASAGREFFAAAESAAADYKKTADELKKTAAIMKILPEQN